MVNDADWLYSMKSWKNPPCKEVYWSYFQKVKNMAWDYLALAAGRLDMEFIKKHSYKLNELERTTDNRDFKASTDYVLEIMREAGFDDIERYALPCDGVTTYDDCTMPLAWTRTGRSMLGEVGADGQIIEPLLADTDQEVLNAVIWSSPTPPDGVTAELVSLKAVESEDWHEVKGRIVLCHRSPAGDLMRKLTLAGAVGLVSYVEETLATNPDDVRWMNGVGWRGWYYTGENQPIWNFSITPRRGAALNERLANGEKINLKAVMNTRVYEGEIYTVTGRIPGESSSELALFAHMYEPFVADDAAGVVISIAIGKALRDLVREGLIPKLEKSIRVVFGMERYGFSEYFRNPKNSRRIIAGMNMDSVCHRTLKDAGVLPELRHSPASAPFFCETIIREHLRKSYPELPFRETPGNLSDDTFGADTPYNIPTGWLHTPPAVYRHHNSGAIFDQCDWQLAQTVAEVITACYMELALVRKHRGDRSLAKKVLKAIKNDAAADFKRLQQQIKSGDVNAYSAGVIGDYLIDYHTRRVTAVNTLVAGSVAGGVVKKKLLELRKKYAPTAGDADIYELTNSELRMAYMYIKRHDDVRQLMSLARLPEPERYGFIAMPEMLLCALLDGKRSLYEAYVISNFILKRSADFKETAGLVATFKKLAQYGYYQITYANELTGSDLTAALQALGVKNSDKLIVHSAYGSLGGVQGGPAAVAQCLIDYCGKKGVLMMPVFNFPYYMGKSQEQFFDVQQTPSCVGAVTEAFRQHPEVVRSLNPSHSIAVYGRKNFDWIKDHHKTLTMGSDSPLGKLEQADGYALMINCADSVTFMHVVETSNRVHCLGLRNEEFNTKLPDGRIVPVRTWGWRGGNCCAYKRQAIFDYLRKHGLISEVMVRHSLWQYFKLSDYRKAYEKVVLHGRNGCMQCPVLPRQSPHNVVSDWDPRRQTVRANTTAFVGDWEP